MPFLDGLPARALSSDLDARGADGRGCSGSRGAPTDPRWREIDIGDWAGHTLDELDPEDVAAWQRGELAPPNAETSPSSRRAWRRRSTSCAGRTRVVVTHGGCVRAATAHLTGADPRRLAPPANASLTVIEHGERVRLHAYGLRAPDLPGDARPGLTPHIVMKLSVIVPVYNEEPRLRSVLTDRLFPAPCPIEREWILVDDGSTDGSGSILDEAANWTQDTVHVLHKPNGGKGTAVRAGLRLAEGDVVMVHDADAEYDPTDIPQLLEPLLRDQADVVYGSRFRRERHQVHRTFHFFVNRFLTLLSNVLSGIYLTDMETCYKLARTDLLRSMRLRVAALRVRDRDHGLRGEDRGASVRAPHLLQPQDAFRRQEDRLARRGCGAVVPRAVQPPDVAASCVHRVAVSRYQPHGLTLSGPVAGSARA